MFLSETKKASISKTKKAILPRICVSCGKAGGHAPKIGRKEAKK